jgi:quercetin dioxygenase-like cupin family protein
MKSRLYEEWKFFMAGVILLSLLAPPPALAQAKDPRQYKIFKADEFVKMENPNPKQPYRLEILTDKDDAKDLGGIFGIRTPAAPGSKVIYHYHKNRESILFIISGEGLEMVEGKAIPVKAGDLIFIRPDVKHTLVNNTDKDLKYLEFFTYPPVMSDYIEVKD